MTPLTVCTYCSQPILTTEKTGTGPNGKVHYRCVKRGPIRNTEAVLVECQACHAIAFSPLLQHCLHCKKGLL